MKIKVIGNKSSNQMKLLKNIKKALDSTKLEKVPTIDVIDKDKNYQIKNSPALVINENLVCEGKVLTEREISRVLKEYEYSNT